MAKAYNKELADAAFALQQPGQKAGPFETPAGIEIVKLQLRTPALDRAFDQSKDAIRGRLARERRSHDYDEWMKKLRGSTSVSIDEAELAKVTVDMPAAPQQHASASAPAAAGPRHD
jgi:hypothetical protein